MVNRMKGGDLLLLTIVLITVNGCQTNKKTLDVEHNDKEIHEIVNKDKLPDTTNTADALSKAYKAKVAGKLDLAQAYYISAYDSDPDNIEILEEMADLYRQLNNNELELLSYSLILDKQPENIQIMERYGLLLIRLKKMSEAEQVLSKVITKAKSWKAYNGLGIIADMKEEHKKARLYFDKAGTISPDNPEILNNIGYSLYMEGEIKRAQGYFLWAIKINKMFKKAIYNYALTLARQRKYSEALAIFSKVMKIPNANNNTGYLAMKNGDYDKAEYYLQRAVKLSPKHYQKAYLNMEELRQLRKGALLE